MKTTCRRAFIAVAAMILAACGTSVQAQTQNAQTTFPKNAVLSGRVVYADGRPAPGIPIIAQAQDDAEMRLAQKLPHSALNSLFKSDTSEAVTRPDGSYRLAVLSRLPYNIMVNLAKPPKEDDETVQWVAAAKVGFVGKAGKTKALSDLVLTQGVFVTGRVTDCISHLPVSGVYVSSYGPSRPNTSAMCTLTTTDYAGQYRLRVIPGSNLVYISDGRYRSGNDGEAKAKGLMKTIMAEKGQGATVDFQVRHNQPTSMLLNHP